MSQFIGQDMCVCKIPLHVSHWDTRGKQSRKNNEDWSAVLRKEKHCVRSDVFCYFVGWKEIKWFQKSLDLIPQNTKFTFQKQMYRWVSEEALPLLELRETAKPRVRFEKGLSYTNLLFKDDSNSGRKLPSQLHEAIIKNRGTTSSDVFLLLVHQCFQKSRKKCMT